VCTKKKATPKPQNQVPRSSYDGKSDQGGGAGVKRKEGVLLECRGEEMSWGFRHYNTGERGTWCKSTREKKATKKKTNNRGTLRVPSDGVGKSPVRGGGLSEGEKDFSSFYLREEGKGGK